MGTELVAVNCFLYCPRPHHPRNRYAGGMTTSTRFDVRRIQLRHYRSIASCDIELGPFTILVGPNGSGKSNFIDSLSFVSQALGENLDNALRERGGVAELRRRSAGHPTHFGIRFDVGTASMAASYGFQIGAVQGGDYRVTHESCRVDSAEFGQAPTVVEVRDGQVVKSSLDVPLPRASTDRLFLVALSGLHEFRDVYDGLVGCHVYSLNPDVMRQPQKPDPGELLTRDGGNIASVLEHLRRTDPERKARVEAYLRQIVPGVDSVDRRAIGAWESLEFKQRVAGAASPWTFQAASMSDGTMRALGVLVALYATGDGPASPVAVEEPEAALHPAAAGLLLEALRGASRTRQVLATSHSPDLLDGDIGADELLAVRSDDGTTVVSRVDDAGQSVMRERLYTAGELLRADQLVPERSPAIQGDLF